MNITSLYFDPGTGSIEILIFQLSFKASVYGISKGGTEMFYIKKVYPFSDFFVGRKADPDSAVFHFWMLHQIFGSGHDLCHPCFIVGSQQRRTVGCDQGMPLEKSQLRKICQRHRQLLVQTDISPIVIFNDTGMDIGPTHIGTRIDMRDKTDHRPVFIPGSCRNSTHRITIGIDFHILQPQLFHLFGQIIQQNQLFRSRRIGFTLRITLGIESDIFQKTLF